MKQPNRHKLRDIQEAYEDLLDEGIKSKSSKNCIHKHNGLCEHDLENCPDNFVCSEYEEDLK